MLLDGHMKIKRGYAINYRKERRKLVKLYNGTPALTAMRRYERRVPRSLGLNNLALF